MTILDHTRKHERNNRSEAALMRWVVNAMGGAAVAPIVALVLLALASAFLTTTPAWVIVLQIFVLVALWGLIVLDHYKR